MLLAEVDDRRQVDDVSIHAEHGVDHNQRRSTSGSVELAGERIDVVMFENQELGLRRSAAIDDAGVVPFVADHDALAIDEGGDGRQIGHEAAAVDDRLFGSHERRELSLQPAMQHGSAAEQPDAMVAGAERVDRFHGGRSQPRVMQEPKVLVRAKHQHPPTADHNPGAVVRLDLRLEEVQLPVLERPDPLIHDFVVVEQLRAGGRRRTDVNRGQRCWSARGIAR